MPYVKRKYPVRKRRYTKPAPSRWSIYGSAGKQLAKDVLYLKTLINSEPHRYETFGTNNFNWTGLIFSLCDVPQGDQDTQRTGNRILPRYLNVSWQVVGAEANSVVRILLFRYWGETTSAAPAVIPNEILENIGTTYAPLSHLNDDNVGPKGDRQRRIEVHRSLLLNIDRTERSAEVGNWDVEVNGMNTQRKEHMEWRGVPTEQPISGGFYLMVIGDSVANGSFKFDSKLVFYDN